MMADAAGSSAADQNANFIMQNIKDTTSVPVPGQRAVPFCAFERKYGRTIWLSRPRRGENGIKRCGRRRKNASGKGNV